MKRALLVITCAVLAALPSCARKSSPSEAAGNAGETKQVSVKKNAYEVKTLPLALNKKILETIQDEYKGQVVLFDLWATWCGPCRMAMAAVDSIKPELAKKGVKFVYITGETSPEGTWKQMIPNIAGDHYRITKEQWEQLCREQGVQGIPCYKVIARDGSEVFSNLTQGGYPGNEFIKATLENALAKKEKSK